MPFQSGPGDQPLQADVDRMNQIERELAHEIATRYQHNTEVALIAGALLRIVRKLYDKYPEGVRAELIEGAVVYLVERRPNERSLDLLEQPERLGLALTDLARKGRRKKVN